jgi:hypothetical protein
MSWLNLSFSGRLLSNWENSEKIGKYADPIRGSREIRKESDLQGLGLWGNETILATSKHHIGRLQVCREENASQKKFEARSQSDQSEMTQ